MGFSNEAMMERIVRFENLKKRGIPLKFIYRKRADDPIGLSLDVS